MGVLPLSPLDFTSPYADPKQVPWVTSWPVTSWRGWSSGPCLSLNDFTFVSSLRSSGSFFSWGCARTSFLSSSTLPSSYSLHTWMDPAACIFKTRITDVNTLQIPSLHWVVLWTLTWESNFHGVRKCGANLQATLYQFPKRLSTDLFLTCLVLETVDTNQFFYSYEKAVCSGQEHGHFMGEKSDTDPINYCPLWFVPSKTRPRHRGMDPKEKNGLVLSEGRPLTGDVLAASEGQTRLYRQTGGRWGREEGRRPQRELSECDEVKRHDVFCEWESGPCE